MSTQITTAHMSTQITTADRTRLTQAKDLFATGKLAQAVAIREIFDKKLYNIEGYENRDDYCQEVLQISPAQGKILYKVATSFGLTMDTLKAPKSQPVSFLNDANKSEGNQTDAPSSATSIKSLSITTLYELSRLQDEERDILTKEGYLFDAEGNKITLSEVQGMTKRQVQEMIREKTKSAHAAKQRLEEVIREKDAIIHDLQTHITESETAVRVAKELEVTFGVRALESEAKISRLKAAYNNILEAAKTLESVKIDDNDLEVVREEGRIVLYRIEALHQHTRNRFALAL